MLMGYMHGDKRIEAPDQQVKVFVVAGKEMDEG